MHKKLKFVNSRLFLSFLAIVGGAILPLSFAPFGYYLLAEISLILLLFTWFRANPSSSFWYGWLFGVAFFGGGVYWIYNSIHDYGHAPVVLALLILILLVVFMALYPALLGYLLNRFFPKNNLYKFLLVFPAGFVILEWIRGWFLSGFPWLFLGYGHIDSPIRGFGAVFGVYGISFAIAVTSGAIFSIIYWIKDRKKVFFSFLIIAFIWVSGFIFTNISWSKQFGDEIQVSLVQGNVPQEEKWEAGNVLPILNSYSVLTIQNLTSKIIVWPEAAIPTYPQHVDLYLKLLSFTAKSAGVTVLSGAPFYDEEKKLYYNGLLALGSDSGRYYKRHLVPFGEYFPLKSLLKWLRNYLIIPMSDFSSGGKEQKGIFVDKITIAPFVCYEIAYPGLVLDYLPKAGLLVTVSDDSWFGDSMAPFQHLEIARMRSLEVGRYQLFSTNTGISAVIDDRGKIVAKTPMFEKTVLTEKVKNRIGSTPWVGFGQYLWLPLLLAGLFFAWGRRNR